MTTRPLYVGIDLGTTNSAVAVFDGKDLTLVRNGQGSVLTPSVVRIDARGHMLIGARARRYLDSDPANTRSEFKRLMGTAHQLEFPASKSTRRPEELSAEILKSLRQDVADQLGVAPECAVISVPALFELHQSAAASEAARLAGFERVELIQEPVASAIAAGWTHDDGKGGSNGPWLVYDLGGGTFDVSLLETRDGLLRVVGHDGDNFLGGRDFDRALVELVRTRLAAEGTTIDPADPRQAPALRRLRLAAEEAKIELTRATEASIFLAGLNLGGTTVDVDAIVTRADYEAAIAPLIDRSLAICTRLLESNGLASGGLERVVLVGGPTVTPLLREKVRTVLGASFGEGLDPMTLVAQGAALFAGTVALDGRPAAAAPAPTGARVWLQFPAMTSDLSPFVVGRLLDSTSDIKAVKIDRADGGWHSDAVPCEMDGTFAVMVRLLARQNTAFEVHGLREDGSVVALQPTQFAITHGITLGEPPLSRSIGVALADGHVRLYFSRGCPLPVSRTFVLYTVETFHPGSEGHVLKVPIVQGELAWAHLCRLVGTLEIPSAALDKPLPVGTEVELTIELDRGGRLRAQARIAGIDRVFDQVALLVTPQVSLTALDEALAKLRTRAAELSRAAFHDRSGKTAARLSAAMPLFDEVARNIVAARGGDLDAGEQARRELADFDALLAEVEAEQAWPELGQKIENEFAGSLSWVAGNGSDIEKSTLTAAYQACKRAFVAQDADEVQRQLAVIERLGLAAYLRHPGAWEWEFERAAARVSESTDLRRATELVTQGRDAVRQHDRDGLERVVRELWRLRPVDRDEQKLGHGSGLRSR
jgi:molecular chaperone DnaK